MRNDALYTQGQWTMQRLTLQGALRFDHAWSWAPDQQIGPARFMPNPLIFPKTPVVDSYKDFTPRVAAAYDLFGNGRTAIKGTFGKYLESTITASNYGIGNPTSRIVQNVGRICAHRAVTCATSSAT
jgi:outer membrane receptor protein involved in Fe transport